jgi:hypothetical protein
MKAALVTLITLWCVQTLAGNYYDSQTVRQFTLGRATDGSLLDIVKRAAGRNFRALGYKRGSKPALFGEIELERDASGYFIKDVYCGFIIRDRVGPRRQPKNNVMNTEHTWPQSKGSKREPARGDLHHLFPSDSRANSARGNHPFGEVVEPEDATRHCSLSQRGDILDPQTGKSSGRFGFQPPREHRGNVARAMFYVSARYGYRIGRLEEYWLRKWHLDDPVDAKELARNDAVEKAQGNRNPFVDYPELTERISDF